MEQKTDGAFMEKYGTPLALVLGAIIIAAAFAFGRAGMPTDVPVNTGDPVAVDIKNIAKDSGPTVGEKDAPVAMAVWYDYQCPFCQRFELDTMSQVYENYVKTGKVQVLLKDFQFLGEYSDIPDRDDSMTAALFARSVWELYPDKFYDWYIVMAEHQDEENAGFGDLASIQAMTTDIGGFDVDRITKVMEDKKVEFTAEVNADRDEGSALGVTGTPSIVIGTTMLSGAQSYEKVSALLEAELAK